MSTTYTLQNSSPNYYKIKSPTSKSSLTKCCGSGYCSTSGIVDKSNMHCNSGNCSCEKFISGIDYFGENDIKKDGIGGLVGFNFYCDGKSSSTSSPDFSFGNTSPSNLLTQRSYPNGFNSVNTYAGTWVNGINSPLSPGTIWGNTSAQEHNTVCPSGYLFSSVCGGDHHGKYMDYLNFNKCNQITCVNNAISPNCNTCSNNSIYCNNECITNNCPNMTSNGDQCTCTCTEPYKNCNNVCVSPCPTGYTDKCSTTLPCTKCDTSNNYYNPQYGNKKSECVLCDINNNYAIDSTGKCYLQCELGQIPIASSNTINSNNKIDSMCTNYISPSSFSYSLLQTNDNQYYDNGGNDISPISQTAIPLSKCKNICSNNTSCVGFAYSSSGMCYPKHALQNISSNNYNTQLYIKSTN